MGKSIIDGLFYGGISAFSRSVAPNAEHARINQQIEEERGYFISQLSADDSQRFEAFNNLCEQANSYVEQDSFEYGLRLGVMLMAEIFVAGDCPIPQD